MNEAEYEVQARKFLTGPPGSGVLDKLRMGGDIVRYNLTTNEFGVITQNGIIRTYFAPARGMAYFNAQ